MIRASLFGLHKSGVDRYRDVLFAVSVMFLLCGAAHAQWHTRITCDGASSLQTTEASLLCPESPIAPNGLLISFNGRTRAGHQNFDSVILALSRLGITAYDTLDRDAFGDAEIDYTPWKDIIWSSGDPAIPLVAGSPMGQSGLSLKEIRELKLYLASGKTYAKKSLIVAGENVAYQNDYLMANMGTADTEFMRSWMHTVFVANSPAAGDYSSPIIGRQLDYNSFPDVIKSASPDVVKPALVTPVVGPEVNWFAYSYSSHPGSADSGAGTTYKCPTYNAVFLAFDWRDPIQTNPGEAGILTSGATRVLRGALDFIASHGSTQPPASVRANDAEEMLIRFDPEHPIRISNGYLRIPFILSEPAIVSCRLFDAAARTAMLMQNRAWTDGTHEWVLQAPSFSNGNYFCELSDIVKDGTSRSIVRAIHLTN